MDKVQNHAGVADPNMSDLESGGGVNRRSLRQLVNVRIVGVVSALIGVVAIFSILTPSFLTLSNISEIIVQSSIIAIVAIGLTIVIVTGGIDLSVGSMVGLVSVVVATNLVLLGPVLGIAVGLVFGTMLGMFNGAMSSYFTLQSFVVTLATLNLFRGLAFLYTDGQPIFGIDQSFRNYFVGTIGPIPIPIILLVGTAAASYILLERTKVGVHLRAVGTDPESSRRSGIRVKNIKVFAFAFSGFTAGLAALLLTARLGAAEPISGMGFELTAIAAVVVGGTSLMGGRASIVGTVLGALLIGSIRTGLTLLNVSPYLQLVVTGLIILIAILIDRFIGSGTRDE